MTNTRKKGKEKNEKTCVNGMKQEKWQKNISR